MPQASITSLILLLMGVLIPGRGEMNMSQFEVIHSVAQSVLSSFILCSSTRSAPFATTYITGRDFTQSLSGDFSCDDSPMII